MTPFRVADSANMKQSIDHCIEEMTEHRDVLSEAIDYMTAVSAKM